MEEQALRAKVREVLQAGKLPHRRPDGTWGGPGFGAACAVCDLPVETDQMELEIEFAHDGDYPGLDTYHVHIRCFAAWEFERKEERPLVASPPDDEVYPKWLRPPNLPVGPRVLLPHNTPAFLKHELAQAPPLNRAIVARDAFVGRWVHWSGTVRNVTWAGAFYTVLVAHGRYAMGEDYVHLKFPLARRGAIEHLRLGQQITYEAQILDVESTPIVLIRVEILSSAALLPRTGPRRSTRIPAAKLPGSNTPPPPFPADAHPPTGGTSRIDG
jgi:hypothetical protein